MRNIPTFRLSDIYRIIYDPITRCDKFDFYLSKLKFFKSQLLFQNNISLHQKKIGSSKKVG
jgi:hypothetical protein